jgi:hypothetical protein
VEFFLEGKQSVRKVIEKRSDRRLLNLEKKRNIRDCFLNFGENRTETGVERE